MGSLAFIIGHYGLVSADYEYVNYSQARFNSTDDSYSDANNQINRILNPGGTSVSEQSGGYPASGLGWVCLLQ